MSRQQNPARNPARRVVWQAVGRGARVSPAKWRWNLFGLFSCITTCWVTPAIAEESATTSFPDGLEAAYVELANSILTETAPSFMKMFHRDFIYEGLDGAAQDRGPWRRLWLERFAERRYERMVFVPLEVTNDGASQKALKVRRIAVIVHEEDGRRVLEQAIYDDTWTRTGEVWSLEFRTETAPSASGSLPSAGGGEVQSPRLAALAAKVAAGDPAAVEAFWRERHAKGPLVEPIEGASEQLVTFLWRGAGSETRVELSGDTGTQPLRQLGVTGLWHLSARYPADAYFTYEFDVESSVDVPAFGAQKATVLSVRGRHADPLSAATVDDRSFLRLPGAPMPAVLTKVEGRPAGSVERRTLESDVLGERRFVSVYLPSNYDDLEDALHAVFLLDDGDYSSRRATAVLLDNLTAEKKIPPVVAFMIHGEGASRPELEPDVAFVKFLSNELLSWAQREFDLLKGADDTVIGGLGLGATLAAYAASEKPEAFGNVFLQNGEFGGRLRGAEARLGQRLAAGERLPLRFHLEIAELGEPARASGTRQLGDLLQAKGYSAKLLAFSSDENSVAWRAALARALPELLGGE